MIVFDLVGNESHPTYQTLAIENLDRQYDFLRSIVLASISLGRPLISIEVIKALNYHAISCLHSAAGEFRPCDVQVGANSYIPPSYWRVPSLMNLFVDEINRRWDETDPVVLTAFVLWKLNAVHPFINGNGRTARVACYFVLCLKLGGWLGGSVLLPELIRRNRDEYVRALKEADTSANNGQLDLSALHGLLTRLLAEQTATVNATPALSGTPSA